ncbi:MAG: hypothetical protein HY093_04855 [Candidatus Liptonbacteria bacterium]|nr:hypothetical protein [Candidatus Liptonbacteria bacterium]
MIRIIQIRKRGGQLSLQMVFFAAIVVILISGFTFAALSFLKLSVRAFNKSLAFTIAESGIEYYRWHLAHAPKDYQDGTGSAGPYTHNYYDKSGNLIGQFVLDITAPTNGSTIVNIKSTGKALADSSVEKVIKVRMGIPSFAKFAWVLNDYVRFGSAAEVFGLVHSNSGLRFDGLAHNLVTSAQTTFDDPDHSGANEFGVHTHSAPTDPLPPAAVPSRPDVFMAGRQFPVPAVDFGKITQDLALIKTAAQASGTYFGSSTVLGYDLQLATSGIFTIYKVTALTAPPGGCSNSGQSGWGTWSIQTETIFATGTIPANGNIFVEDNLWVRGQIKNKRLTIASGRFPDNPATRSSITVNSDVLYTNYDGSDVIALLAQNNINVGLVSEDDLRVDAAMMTQNGRVGRYSYAFCGSNSSRALFTSYGMLGSALRPAFNYSASNGYQQRDYIYDSYLLYGPPPSFPLSSDQYSLISWEEVQ